MRFTLITAAALGAAALITGCVPPNGHGPLRVPDRSPSAAPACEPGEVVVWDGEPVPCDLDGAANTLTVLGITEADCDGRGGRWWYEACLDVDF